MVHATIKMLIPTKRRSEVLEILSSVAEGCRFAPGCISRRVQAGVEVGHAVMLEELWRYEEDLERHLRSEEQSKVVLIVEMALEPPEI